MAITPESLAKSGSEASHQVALFQWAALSVGKYPMLRLMIHIPNGGYRNAREGASLKAQGVKAGFPDIVLFYPYKEYHRLIIEMKKIGGKVAPKQTDWLYNLDKVGYCCNVCYSWTEAKDTIIRYLE